jgi:hypothetical protein
MGACPGSHYQEKRILYFAMQPDNAREATKNLTLALFFHDWNVATRVTRRA